MIIFFTLDVIVTILCFALVIYQMKVDSRKRIESHNYNSSVKYPSEFYLFLFFISLVPIVNACYFVGYETNYIYHLLINKLDQFRNLNDEKNKSALSMYKKLRSNLTYAKIFKNDQEINDFIESVDVYNKLKEN